MIKIDKKTKTIFADTDNLNLLNRQLKYEGITDLISIDEKGFHLKPQWSIQLKGNK
jgi:hypothetical protein